MNFLDLVNTLRARTGMPQLSAVAANTEPQAVQLLSLVGEVLEDLTQAWTWSELIRESVFTTVDGEDQGAMTTLAPYGFKWVLNATIMNRTLRLPLYGPISPPKWQALKALPNAGPFYKYRIVRGNLLFNPAGVADQTCAFEYASSYAVLGIDGTTYKAYPTADTDTFVLDDVLILAGLRWKWKYEKGLDYAEDFRRYEEMINNAKGRDGTKAVLDLSGGAHQFQPGIFVPSGNWNIS